MPRFRIKTLMIAVVIIALSFGGLVWLQRMDQRRQGFLAQAREHERQEAVNRLTLQGLLMHGAASPSLERHRVLTEYHHALDLKYTRYARYPWLPVQPDPPLPE